MPATALAALLLIWALAIAGYDWFRRRVPNLLLLALLLPTAAMLVWRGEGPLGASWPYSLLGLVIGFLVTVPGYAVSRLGAGDVKLAAVLGLVQGWPMVSWTLMAAALMLGAMSLAAVTVLGFANARSARIPAAIAIVGGFGLVLVAQRMGWAGEWR